MTLCRNIYSMKMKTAGAVVFIRLLLLIAGVQPNPGPPDKFIFRLLYLLVEIGGEILRSIFDQQVGHDLMRYLNVYPGKNKRLVYLTKNIIKGEERKLLPPINWKPNTKDFDITILSLLLRNICGLKRRDDVVWNPPVHSSDVSLEADITRIRDYRNILDHSPSVLIPPAEFKQKWDDICVILSRLNQFAKLKNLSELIENAKYKEIDDHLKARLDETLKRWREYELINQEIERLKKRVDSLELAQKDINTPEQNNLQRAAEALKDYLIKTYKITCSTLPVTALSEADDEIELSTFYQPLYLIHRPYHRSTEDDKEYKISSFKEMFYKGEQCYKNIYVTGDAGVGKSSLCQCMALLWSKAQSNQPFQNKDLQEDVDFMQNFDFVFYISLRDTYRVLISRMIIDLLLEFNDNRDEMKELLTFISEQYKCLIILDGLDEWTPVQETGMKLNSLPRKILSEKCTYLTACRSYKIENKRLAERDIDHQVYISGMSKPEKYVVAIIQYFNTTMTVQRDVNDFFTEVKQCDLDDKLRIPVITTHLIVLWFKQTLTKMSRAEIYANILEMLFERAAKKADIKPQLVQSSDVQCPDCLIEFNYTKQYLSLIEKVCLLSFRSLFKLDDSVCILVFTKKKLMFEPYCITSEEMDSLCKLGILSKHKVVGDVGESAALKLSFPHKSFMEFYAAMYVSCFDDKNQFSSVIMQWTKLHELLEYDNFLLLLSGICHEKVVSFLKTMYHVLSDDMQLCRKHIEHKSDLSINDLIRVQNIILNCFIEIITHLHVDRNVSLKLEDFTLPNNSENIEMLAQLLLFNKNNVKYLCTRRSKCSGILLDHVYHLQHLYIDYETDVEYDSKYNNLMLQNKTSLQTVGILGTSIKHAFIPAIPIKDLSHLTSLYLAYVAIPHTSLSEITTYLSFNVNIQCISLLDVECNKYQFCHSSHNIELLQSSNIERLELSLVNVIIPNINTSNLKFLKLWPKIEPIGRSYTEIFKDLNSSRLVYLVVEGDNILDDRTIKQLLDTITTLRCIETIHLQHLSFPDDTYLRVKSNLKQMKIKLLRVTMSNKSFESFIECCIDHSSHIVGSLQSCSIKTNDKKRRLYSTLALDHMYQYLESEPNVKVIYRNNTTLEFETTN